jgi:putative flippase GtrA
MKMKRAAGSSDQNISPSTLVRWCKFNFVGGIGIVVQFAALFLLKSALRFNYLAATAIAVEAAVVHNFVWHEQFTWADRTRPGRTKSAQPRSPAEQSLPSTSGAEAPIDFVRECGAARSRALSKQKDRVPESFRRFLRFNLTTGAVSILGNLALMKVMVGAGHMNYLLANAIAILLCSLANFLVSETWVFERETRAASPATPVRLTLRELSDPE